MKKEILKDIEKAITLEEEIINEYNRLREKKTNYILGKEKFTPYDSAQLEVFEHLVNIIL